MKLVSILLLSASLAVGHALPSNNRGLVARAGQELKNLDNEPDYEDPVTGSKIPKSRILSGVGPVQADNRWFDWDESCSDASQRAKILSTFQHINELSDWTSKHLNELLEGLPNPVGASVNKDNQKYIFDQDPAYAQMFLGQDNRIQYIIDTFDLVTKNSKISPETRGGSKPGALRFICSADNKVLDGTGSQPYCGTGNLAAQAVATSPYDPKYKLTIEPKYSFEKSSSITFCTAFFDNAAFPSIDVVVGSGSHTLDKVDCAERILLHEYMHLPWIRNMPGKPDYTGYYKAAKYAGTAGWGPIKVNPDNYAWLALYAYFNNEKGCGNDVWPADGEAKPNKEPQ